MLCHFQNHIHSLKPLCLQADLSPIHFQDFWQEVIQQSDLCLEIPQFGTKHSFNVSVTAGIVMWEFFKNLHT